MKKSSLISLLLFILLTLSACGGREMTQEEALAEPTVDDRPEVFYF